MKRMRWPLVVLFVHSCMAAVAQIPEGYNPIDTLDNDVLVLEKDDLWYVADLGTGDPLSAGYDDISESDEINPEWLIVRLHGKIGFIDRYGMSIVQPQFDEVFPFHEIGPAFALVRIGSRYGCIETYEGSTVLPVEYDEVLQLDTLSRSMLVRKGEFWGLYQPDEMYLMIPCKYESLEPIGAPDSDLVLVRRKGKYGVMFRWHEEVLPCEFDRIIVTEQQEFLTTRGTEQKRWDLEGHEISE